MTTTGTSPDQWNDCQPGELGALASHLKVRRRTRAFKKIASVLGAMALFLAAGSTLLRGPAPQPEQQDVTNRQVDAPPAIESKPAENSPTVQKPASRNFYAGISCGDVIRLANRYFNGDVDKATSDKIRQHLAECPHCLAHLEQMKPKGAGRPGNQTGALDSPAGEPVPRGAAAGGQIAEALVTAID